MNLRWKAAFLPSEETFYPRSDFLRAACKMTICFTTFCKSLFLSHSTTHYHIIICCHWWAVTVFCLLFFWSEAAWRPWLRLVLDCILDLEKEAQNMKVWQLEAQGCFFLGWARFFFFSEWFSTVCSLGFVCFFWWVLLFRCSLLDPTVLLLWMSGRQWWFTRKLVVLRALLFEPKTQVNKLSIMQSKQKWNNKNNEEEEEEEAEEAEELEI